MTMLRCAILSCGWVSILASARAMAVGQEPNLIRNGEFSVADGETLPDAWSTWQPAWREAS